MIAEIISNGDELTGGKILDTNAQWLSRELTELGISVLYHTTIGDELPAMTDVLRIAIGRADLIIWTGGLGPTADDLTRHTIAEVLQVPLVKNEQAMDHLLELFKKRQAEMPPSNEIQAHFPEGASPIPNPYGTAPGIDLVIQRADLRSAGKPDQCRIQAYPGVPAELKEMWALYGRDSIRNWVQQLSGRPRVIQTRSIHSFGAGESVIEQRLQGLIHRDHIPRVGITASQGIISLRIIAEAESEEQCRELIETTTKRVQDELNELIFGRDDQTLAGVVCEQLAQAGETLACVESGTGGFLARLLSRRELPPCFSGAMVLPDRWSTTRDPKTIAKDMIQEGLSRFPEVDNLLLVGPYPAGIPDRNRPESVFVALYEPKKETDPEIESYLFVGHPDIMDSLFAHRALNLLRKHKRNKN